MVGPDGSRKEHQIKYRRNSSKRWVDWIHLELHIDVSFDLLCDERMNGLMPRQRLAQPDHLKRSGSSQFHRSCPTGCLCRVWSVHTVHGHRDAKASSARSAATEDAMPLADGGVVCNCDKP